MRLILLLILLIPISRFQLLAEDEIVVHLTSQESFTPISLASIDSKESSFDQNYLLALERVLRFDFEHNGKTEIKKGASIKIEPAIVKKMFRIKLTNSSRGSVKGLEGIPLTGQLPHDRQIMHRMHDAIFETLFQTPGIASTRILYTLRTKSSLNPSEWLTEVWEADYDGYNRRQITHEGALCVTPVYIPPHPGERTGNFLYVSYQVGQPKIYVASLANGAGRRLTYLRGNQLMPFVSPTLDKLAFISDITGNPDLFIQEFSVEKGLIGKPRQIFAAAGAAQGTPVFSPDGTKIAFVSNKDGTPRIYILEIPPEGTSLHNIKTTLISKKTRNNTCPAWSPDGKKIAYSATVAGTRQIWIYDLSTKEELQLTDGYGHKENPSWAPNSIHLVFNSSTPQASELFLINLNQKNAIKLEAGLGEKRFPSWEPIIFNTKGRL